MPPRPKTASTSPAAAPAEPGSKAADARSPEPAPRPKVKQGEPANRHRGQPGSKPSSKPGKHLSSKPGKKPGKPPSKKSAKEPGKQPSKKQVQEADLARRLDYPLFPCTPLGEQPQVAWPAGSMRLGFAVKVMGQQGLKSNDTRRWQADPHLRVSLGHLCEIFAYLRKHRIHMYRMSSDLAPYATHPDMPRFHSMVRESASDLAYVGRLAREGDLRLSFHPSQFIVLNSEKEELTRKSMWDLDSQAEILDRMECGPEARLVIHVGGAYGDRESGCRRWCATWKRLSEPVQRRLVLENDDIRYSAADVLRIHEETGVPLIFDYQHFWCFNPEKLGLLPTIERMLATWPAGVRPKLHYSCARTELREIKRRNRKTGKIETVLQPPIWTGHADYNNPFETIAFLRMIAPFDADIMLEAKAKDLALLRLRADIARYAPELAPRYNITLEDAAEDPSEIVAETEDEGQDLALDQEPTSDAGE